jgi:hypothetical protein
MLAHKPEQDMPSRASDFCEHNGVTKMQGMVIGLVGLGAMAACTSQAITTRA